MYRAFLIPNPMQSPSAKALTRARRARDGEHISPTATSKAHQAAVCPALT